MTNSTQTRKPRATAKAATPKSAPAVAKKVAAKKAAPKVAVKPTPPVKVKHKLVRDSFTIPKSEYAVLEALKHRSADLKRPAKKSELLRAGIGALNAMTDKAFLAALGGVPSLKTGRPSKAAVD